MSESAALNEHVCSGCHHDQEQATVADNSAAPERFAVPASSTEDAWREIARASWTPGTAIGESLLRNNGTMPDISRQTLDQMMGLSFDPNMRTAMPIRQDRQAGFPQQQRSSIDWDALSRGETVTIQPAVYRPQALPGMNQGRPELPNLRRNLRPEDRNRGDILVPPLDGTAKRLLEPVRDQSVLSRVPDAVYVGQRGLVTSMNNRRGEQQEYWLAGDAGRAFARAQEMLASKGKSIQISDKNGAGRTVDTQTEIYSRSKGGRTFVAGAPTSSNHTFGRALDISNWRDPDVQQALKAAGWRHGDSRGPIKNDLHHWSYPETQMARRPTRQQRTYT